MAFTNHYATLGLSVAVSRKDIFHAYIERRDQLLERESELRAELASKLNPPKPSVPAAQALRAVLGRKESVIRESLPLLPCLEMALASVMTWKASSRRHQAPCSDDPSAATEQEPASSHGDGDDEDTSWHCHTPSLIVARNALADAYAILMHPIKKKCWDSTHLIALQRYEGARIAAETKGSRARRNEGLDRAIEWRKSLLHGHEKGTEWDESKYGRVPSLGGTSEVARDLVAGSGMSGDVVAGWADEMEM